MNEVLLLSCVKDIEKHKSLWSLTGVTGEQELIVLRAGIFTTQQDVSDLTKAFLPFIGLSLALDGERTLIHVELQMRLHITVRVKEIQSLRKEIGVFSPCTDCTLDQ